LPPTRNNITYWKDRKHIINQETTIQRTRKAPNWARDRNWDGLRRPRNRNGGTKKQLSRKSQSAKARKLGDGEELTCERGEMREAVEMAFADAIEIGRSLRAGTVKSRG